MGKVQKKISKEVLPAQHYSELGAKTPEALNTYIRQREQYGVERGRQLQIDCHFEHLEQPGASISYVDMIPQSLSSQPPSEHKVIINLMGNDTCYQKNLDQYFDQADGFGCRAIAMNYRGVADSTSRPKSQNDLINDAVALTKKLIETGIKPENIVIQGHSLGAAIGALVVARLHDEGDKVNLFCNRGFSKTKAAAMFHDPALARKRVITSPILSAVLSSTDWKINAKNAYQQIPNANKTMVAVKGDKLSELLVNALDPTSQTTARQFTPDRGVHVPNLIPHQLPLTYLSNETGTAFELLGRSIGRDLATPEPNSVGLNADFIQAKDLITNFYMMENLENINELKDLISKNPGIVNFQNQDLNSVILGKKVIKGDFTLAQLLVQMYSSPDLTNSASKPAIKDLFNFMITHGLNEDTFSLSENKSIRDLIVDLKCEDIHPAMNDDHVMRGSTHRISPVVQSFTDSAHKRQRSDSASLVPEAKKPALDESKPSSPKIPGH